MHRRSPHPPSQRGKYRVEATNQSISRWDFFLNHRVKPGQTARPGGGGANPVGQPLVYVDTGEFPC